MHTGINKYVDDFNELHIGKVPLLCLSGLRDLICANSTILVVINSEIIVVYSRNYIRRYIWNT